MTQKIINFGKAEKNLPPLDLSLVQRESWEWFLERGVAEEIEQITPIDDFTGKNWQLTLEEPALGKPKATPQQAIDKSLTYSIPFKVKATLINKRDDKRVSQEVFLGNLPQMTEAGTFIVSGIERVVINQLVRSPGIYFQGDIDRSSGRLLHTAEARPLHGSWLEFEVGRNDVVSARIDKRRKLPATALLRAMGHEGDEEIFSLFSDVDNDKNHQYITSTLEKDNTASREEALLEIYRKLRPGEPAVLENAQNLFHSLFFDNRRYNLGKVGRYKINKRLGLSLPNEKENWVITRDDIVATLRYLIGIQNGQGRVDEIDHLSNRRLRRVGELVATHAFRTGLLKLERSVREKMSLISPDDSPQPQNLINARPLIASLNEFFRSNQLSAILDDTNPLSEIDNLRRVSVLGQGGINRERASFSIRDINTSQYGRIDPVRSPEGHNIGLVTYLSLYARINEFGFIETPYRRVRNGKVTDEVVYLTADDETSEYITHGGVRMGADGRLLDARVPVRYNGIFTEGPADSVGYMDLTPRQVFGASASLIPFLPNDDGIRALMGSNMQCQAVPLVQPSSPVVGTGMEEAVAGAMGRVVYSRHNGTVVYADAERVEIELAGRAADDEVGPGYEIVGGGKKAVYRATKFKRTSQSTSYNQKVLAIPGQKVKEGDILIDGPSAENGRLALGQNLVVAYANFEGYGFEDAILISDRLVKEDLLTSVHIKEYQSDVVETKLGPEELTRDIPNVAETELSNLAEDGIVVVGAEVSTNDILVGKIAPKGETELTSEERLLRAIFGEKAREVRDTSLRVPHGEAGIVVGVQILDREEGDELGPGVQRSVIVKVAQLRKVTVGDKVAGRHGNKGVVAKVMPASDMPYLKDGTPVDLIISPLSVLARMNLGQLFETHLGWALSKKGEKGNLPVFDPVGPDFIEKNLREAGLPVDGKARLIDARTGEEYGEPTVVGIGYVMKLNHMIEDKIHARSTGPYSLVTQQPLGGKAQMGGQRLGEMEVWALEAHRAAYTLQEMLTIKSDDIVGRAQAFGAIVKGEPIPEAKIPESFRVLVRELNSLSLSIDIEGAGAPESDGEGTRDTLTKVRDLKDISSLKIRLASSDEVRAWSKGEIVKPETINYRTLKPEKDGLFDERIFGPTKDWECYCGKYKRIRYKGVVCDKCGVEVTESRVRRERMGHISLAAPVAHAWYFKGAPSRMSLLLDLPPKAIEQVVYFARYLVMSVDEKGRKEALKTLQAAHAEEVSEIKTINAQKIELIKKDAVEKKERTSGRIKDKEQLSLTLSEIELEARKRETAVVEEEKGDLARTEEIFAKLTKLVRDIKPFGFFSEEEYDKLSEFETADFVEVEMGAEAILKAVNSLDLNKLSSSLRKEVEEARGKGGPRYVKLTKRLKLVDGLRASGVEPGSMVLSVIPVLPPDLRPMVQLSGGRFATSDLNDLYRRVINRNNRLKHLMVLGAPEIILRNEKRMLQESVDSLIDTSQRKATRRGRGRQPLRSLSDMLKGKQGRFRQNLLGKRVDYSGRSVIVVGPELALTQCGIPKDMALEMAKPFVLREMIARGIAPNVKSAKNMLEKAPPEVYDILEEITRDHPVLLNRAPTLHKLGIQAFYPVLIEGSAIRIHPAVCKGFNADFDGDQMAVHLPLSGKAIDEARELMLSDKNLLRASDGDPIASPATKEIALGVYYLTSLDEELKSAPSVFSDPAEAIFAYQIGKIRLRQKISVRVGLEIVETTVGRLIFNEALPSELGYVNENVSSSIIKRILIEAIAGIGREEVVKMIDEIKMLGFMGGTVSGISFGIMDAIVYSDKEKLIEEANKRVIEREQSFEQGLITAEERRRLVEDVWIETTEEIADKTWEKLKPSNPIRVVIDAKVGRTSREQIKQLSGMRGLVVDPMGKIVELPIKSNFKEGLSVFEYVTSSRGSRKGLTDTALRTADAGYLTRRLVDVAHDVIIRAQDCETNEGVEIRASERPKAFVKRMMGRVVFEDIKNSSGAVLVKKGDVITEDKAEEIKNAGVSGVVVRSPLTCKTRYGICQTCYGWDLGIKKVADIGVPAGVIAAQSIGEPGTQLTMRTKHTGGVVGIDVTQGLPRVEELFESRVPKILSPVSDIPGKVSVKEEEGGRVVIVTAANGAGETKEYNISETSKLTVSDGQLVDAGTQLAEGFVDVKDLLQIKGLRFAQQYLVDELQAVYESQGIPIDDKHFEIIVRKMSDKVRVTSSGDTKFLPGEQVDKATFEEQNDATVAAGGEPATAVQMILGITRRAVRAESWLSSASFQQTTDVLSEAALMGKRDLLYGLKENVIIGRLIPVDKERAMIGQ